ncbi:MAG: hypothetical protein V7638_843 [Acidobacteriota bacterium]|jgi:hypothetical protein
MQQDETSITFRVYCTKCKSDFYPVRAPRIECTNGHVLANNFPHDNFWDYCCSCGVFFPSNALEGNEGESNCSVCDRPIARRFFCDNCKLTTLESDEIRTERLFQLSTDGRPLPSCPGCLVPAPDTSLLTHNCRSLEVTYLTARNICPFCNKRITGPTKVEQKVEKIVQAVVQARDQIGFPFLESFSHREVSFLRSYLPSSKKGWIELLTVVGFVLTILAFVFPGLPTAISWRVTKTLKSPLTVSAIECAAHFVLKGDRLRLKVRADETEDPVQFNWSASAGTLVGRKEQNSQSEVELDTSEISVLTAPAEIAVRVTVANQYGESVWRDERITVMPRRMVNNPPVLKIPPRCNCTLQEVVAGESVSLYALAEDEDKGEALSYEWQSSSPSAQLVKTDSTAGSTVILNTPGVNPRAAAVPVKISLRVSDASGGEVMGDITLMVLPRQLVILPNSSSATPPPPNHSPKLEAFGADKTTVQAGESLRLWALVTDADGDSPIFYDWRTSAGEIQNKNETAILNTVGVTTPEVIVMLTISDGHGGRTSQKMFLPVTTPPVATGSPLPSPIQPKAN